MIAYRYVPVLCVAFACALVPTLIHSYSDAPPHDGLRAAGLSSALASFTSVPSGRNETWGKRRFDSDDWIERTYTNGKRTVRLTVVRSYNHKSLYHHPELAIAYRVGFAGVEATRLPGRPEMPIHVMLPAADQNAAAAYVLHYRDRFVEDPILFQVRTAGELLVSRRQPMTIFFALERAESADESLRPPTDLLVAAIDDFLAQKLDGSPTE